MERGGGGGGAGVGGHYLQLWVLCGYLGKNPGEEVNLGEYHKKREVTQPFVNPSLRVLVPSGCKRKGKRPSIKKKSV
jgi:hypothetical protein